MNKLLLPIVFLLLASFAFAQGGMGPGPGTVHSTGGASSGNVSWNNTQNATISSPDIYHSTGGYEFHAHSVEVISAGANAYFEFKVADNSGTLKAMIIALLPSSGVPYTGAQLSAKLSLRFGTDGGLNVYKDGSYQTDFTGEASTDVFRAGFDGSNHLVVTKNGSAIWTDSATTTTADYILYIYGTTDDGAPGLKSVAYQQ